MADQDAPTTALPPVSFEFFVAGLVMQAQSHMGLLQFPGDDQPEPNLDIARHTIDLLALLQEKTRGNLTLEEQRLLENSLTELRFRFVQVSAEAKKG